MTEGTLQDLSIIPLAVMVEWSSQHQVSGTDVVVLCGTLTDKGR